MALSIFIYLSNFIYGILSFQHKLYVLNNPSILFYVTTMTVPRQNMSDH